MMRQMTAIAACALALAACEQSTQHADQRSQPAPPATVQPAPAAKHKMAPVAQPRGAPAMESLSRATGGIATALPAPPYWSPGDTEQYQNQDDNPLKLALEHPVSTFSIDVDTGAYANTRRFLNDGQRPPKDAVRIEELVNYFSYRYTPPADREVPFSVTTEMARTPWNKDTYLLHVGIKGYEVARDERPAANLVFLVDVSGSMNQPDKLPLLVKALKLLSKQLTARDKVSLVVYAGAAGVVLEPVDGNKTAAIHAALDKLRAGGSTAGGAGIELAYKMAEQDRITDGINRVILATDGDFNVGTVDPKALQNLIEDKRKSGITLTTLGFGTGNYNEVVMERLADKGNGNYAYIDTLNEARKVLVEELSSTIFTIAKDVKIQVEFNPAVVAEYRLIGYENRALKREDFANDKVDAGEIGAGHTVTAMYEIALTDGAGRRLRPLRYGNDAKLPANTDEFAHLRLRYKLPDGDTSQLIERPLMTADLKAAPDAPAGDFRFAAAVAAFGQILRGGTYTGDFGYDQVIDLAQAARGTDPFGYRAEFVALARLARDLE